MKLRYITFVLAFGAMTATPAMACGLHGFSFGAEWEPYPPSGYAANEDLNFTPISTKTDPAKRPVFSNAANRASEIAKRRAKVKAEKKAEKLKEAKLAKVDQSEANAEN